MLTSKMNLQRLHSDVISKIRSSFTINTVSQCVIELVLNSLDAKPSAVAVRLNFVTFRIQVVDNGDGITKENLALVGVRYMTNKCKGLEQLERHVKCYGFRGEALASVIDCSKSVNITSKHSNSSETYSKSIGKHAGNEVVRVKNRPSDGTTVTVEGLFYNLPVRRKRVIAELEMENIKRNIEKLILMHPNISFTIRNDVTSELVLSNPKHKDIVSAFHYLHPDINDDFSVMKVSKSKVTIEALLFKESSDKRLQYIFVNKRPVCSSKIQKFVSCIFLTNLTTEKRKQGNKYPIFVINIKCPHSQVDILLNTTKTDIEFENWNTVLRALEKLVYSFFDNESKLHNKVPRNLKFSEEHFKSNCGVSQVCGAFKSYGYKRKTDEREDLLLNKKLGVGSEIIIESQISQKNDLKDRNGKNVDIATQPHKNAVKPSKNEVGNLNEIKDDNDNYHISATTPHKEVKKRKFTKPLPIKLVTKKKIRKPGIARSYSSMNISPHDELMKRDIEKNKIGEKNNVPLVQDEEKSVLSKFTNDENKGKTLIMDMFLKSTQVYNSEGNTSECSNSQETIYEVESNFLLENNIQTNVNGINKAMSMSVNVKSTKKIRKRKTGAEKVSRCIQTTLQNKEMASKYIQTSLEEKRSKICRKSKNTNVLSESKIPENYTVVFSETLSTNKNPHFKFIHKDPNVCDFGSASNFLFNIEETCKCTCQRNNGNIFNFAKAKPNSDNEMNTLLNKNIELFNCDGDFTQFQTTQDISKTQCQTDNEYFQNFDAKMDLGEDKNGTGVIKKRGEMIPSPRHKVYDRSPYFLCKKNLQHLENRAGMEYQRDNNYPFENYFSHKFPNNPVQKNPYQYFNPVYQYNKNDEYLQNLGRPVYMPDPDNILYMHQNTQGAKDEFGRNFQPQTGSTVESFNKFQPVYCSSQLNDPKNVQEHTDLIFTPTREINSQRCADSLPNLLNVSENANDEIISQINFAVNGCIENDGNAENGFKSSKKEQVFTLPATETWRNTDGPSKLLITLSDQQRQALVEKDMETEQDLLAKHHFQWDSQIHSKQNETQESDFATEWLKKYNNFGNRYYINRKSGFTTFYTPKPVTNQFIIGKRFDFMPKGMSQILKEVKEVDQSLSQSAKDKLVEFIMETHQTELLFVKWQNFIQDIDPKIFLENMYKEKLKVFENCIPNISTVGNKKTSLNNVISFTKELFQNIEIIGQVDKKFIAVLEKLETLLILFDQHAVHERIRLENIANTYKNMKAKCEEPLIYFIPHNDLSLLSQHESYMSALGLSVEFFSNGVNVTEIPLYLYNKFKEDNCSDSTNKIIQLLIKEIIDLLKTTRGGMSSMNIPKVIQNIMNLEACRGAIKFGEALSKENCAELLEKLSKCNLPFQCAHGRPTLAPILTLDLNKKYVYPKLNLKSLKCEGTM